MRSLTALFSFGRSVETPLVTTPQMVVLTKEQLSSVAGGLPNIGVTASNATAPEPALPAATQ